MIILKLLIGILFCTVLITLTLAVKWGIKSSGNSEAQKIHKKWGWRSLWFTLAAVVSVETMIRIHGGLEENVLMKIHLPSAIVYLIILVTLLKFTGHKNPVAHRILGYLCYGAYLCTFFTGIVMLFYF